MVFNEECDSQTNCDEDCKYTIPCLAHKLCPQIEWVFIAGGTYSLDLGDHPLEISVPSFEISRSEVTVAQWERCVISGVCEPYGGDYAALRRRHPAQVKGNKSLSFSRWVNATLPSLHQWRFAATSRGKISQIDINTSICDQGDIEYEGEDCYGEGTSPVCSLLLAQTEQGVCDMIGNAPEILLDGYEFPEDDTIDGQAACSDPSCSDEFRKLAGGQYQPGQENPFFKYERASWFNHFTGLRLVRPPQQWR